MSIRVKNQPHNVICGLDAPQCMAAAAIVAALCILVLSQWHRLSNTISANQVAVGVFHSLAAKSSKGWDADTWRLVTGALLSLEGAEKAEPFFERASAAQPTNGQLLCDLAHAYALTGKKTEALEILANPTITEANNQIIREQRERLCDWLRSQDECSDHHVWRRIGMTNRRVPYSIVIGACLIVLLVSVSVIIGRVIRPGRSVFVACESPKHAQALIAELNKLDIPYEVQIGVQLIYREQLIKLALKTDPRPMKDNTGGGSTNETVGSGD